MEIPGIKIASHLEKLLKKEVRKRKKKLLLCTILVGSSQDQLSFVKIKAKTAKRLGIGFELVHLKNTPSFEDFMHKIKEKSLDPKVTGIIIQQPLPAQLSTESIYEYIPVPKEIEGHRRKTVYLPPIGNAIITVLKYVFGANKVSDEIMVNPKKDKNYLKKILRNKKVILIGRGITGGHPIGKTLTEFKVNYISINSQTPEPQTYIKEADIVITAVGKKVIQMSDLKPGVVLLNVGLRREKNKLKGDYDESDIKKIASYYSPTPGGIGPIDVLYLYKNLIDASK